MPLGTPGNSVEVSPPVLEENRAYRLKSKLGNAYAGLDDIEYFWVPQDPTITARHKLDDRFQFFKFYSRQRWQEVRLPIEVFIGLECPTKPTPEPELPAPARPFSEPPTKSLLRPMPRIRAKSKAKPKPTLVERVLLAYLQGGGTDTSAQVIIVGLVLNGSDGYLPNGTEEAFMCRTLAEDFRWIVENGGRYYLSGKFAQA